MNILLSISFINPLKGYYVLNKDSSIERVNNLDGLKAFSEDVEAVEVK